MRSVKIMSATSAKNYGTSSATNGKVISDNAAIALNKLIYFAVVGLTVTEARVDCQRSHTREASQSPTRNASRHL